MHTLSLFGIESPLYNEYIPIKKLVNKTVCLSIIVEILIIISLFCFKEMRKISTDEIETFMFILIWASLLSHTLEDSYLRLPYILFGWSCVVSSGQRVVGELSVCHLYARKCGCSY
jgi:hypothetical protein